MLGDGRHDCFMQVTGLPVNYVPKSLLGDDRSSCLIEVQERVWLPEACESEVKGSNSFQHSELLLERANVVCEELTTCRYE